MTENGEKVRRIAVQLFPVVNSFVTMTAFVGYKLRLFDISYKRIYQR